MSAKPICVITADLQIIAPITRMSDLLKDLHTELSNRLPDYHVFVLPQEDYSEPHQVLEFQVFYEKDQIPIDYEELKHLVTSISKPKDTQ